MQISRPKPGIPATAPFPLLPLHVQNPPTMRLPSPGSLPAPHSVSASLRFGSHEAVRALALRSVLGVPWAQHRGAVSTACVPSRGTAPPWLELVRVSTIPCQSQPRRRMGQCQGLHARREAVPFHTSVFKTPEKTF